MKTSPFALPAPASIQVSAELEPALNVLLTLWALTADEAPELEPALAQAAIQLTPAQKQFNRWLFAQLGSGLLPSRTDASFTEYLDDLAQQPEQFFQVSSLPSTATSNDFEQAASLVADAPALRHQVVEHLRYLWELLLATEWQRQSRMLVKMTKAMNDLVFSLPTWQATDAYTALRFLLQTEPSAAQLAQLAGVQRIVLAWSPYLLAWCGRLGSADTLWVIRKFDPQLLRRDPLTRAEVLGPLTALTDDTRLRILELLIEDGELRAQEIIGSLESSQGNVSRHLKQLVGASLARERRAGDANKLYEFNEAGLQRLLYLVRQLLSARNAQSIGEQQQLEQRLKQVHATTSPLLHGLLDEQGRITRWSSKLKDQQAMLEYLITKFEPERGYSEKEVNALLQQWYLDADWVLLRRSLVDAGLLKRTRDGARYWVEAPNQVQSPAASD